MTSQTDKLFRDKLENFQRPAPAAAWGRIEAGLTEPGYQYPWIKIAAGIVLLSVAAFLLWPTGSVENESSLAINKEVAPPSEGIVKSNSKETAPIVTDKAIEKKNTTKTKIRKDQPKLVAEFNEIKTEEAIPVIEPSETIVAQVNTETTPTEITHSKTIVYTAEEVNAKFLKKKSADEATSEEKKSSGIQKLMGLAYTLKNTDSGISDLRQKKDEILALNFLTNEDKTKRKN